MIEGLVFGFILGALAATVVSLMVGHERDMAELHAIAKRLEP